MSNTISIANTRGTIVATIAPGTFDITTPMSLAGRGANGFAVTNNQNFIALTENFANNSAPANPLEGQLWYDTSTGMKYRTTSAWIELATGSNCDILLPRLVSASNINLNTVASYNLYTGVSGARTIVTAMLILPRTGASVAAAPPAVALEVAAGTGDVADRVILKGLTSTSTSYRHNIAGSQRIVNAGDTVKLAVKTAIQNTDTLSVDVYLYGITL